MENITSEESFAEREMPLFTVSKKIAERHPLSGASYRISDKAILRITAEVLELKQRLMEVNDEGKEDYKKVCEDYETFSKYLDPQHLKDLKYGAIPRQGETEEIISAYIATLRSASAYVDKKPFWKFKSISARSMKRKNAAMALKDGLSSGTLASYLSQYIPLLYSLEYLKDADKTKTIDVEDVLKALDHDIGKMKQVSRE